MSDPSDELFNHDDYPPEFAADRAIPEQAVEAEREALRRARSALVMPQIGPLLDAWDSASNDLRSTLLAELPELGLHLDNICAAMDNAEADESAQPLMGVMQTGSGQPPEQSYGTKALLYAQRLAEALWEKHWKGDAPKWRPLPELIGTLTQIDNMTSGLVRPHTGQPQKGESAQSDLLAALKAVTTNLEWLYSNIRGEYIPDTATIERARAAIAKAEAVPVPQAGCAKEGGDDLVQKLRECGTWSDGGKAWEQNALCAAAADRIEHLQHIGEPVVFSDQRENP